MNTDKVDRIGNLLVRIRHVVDAAANVWDRETIETLLLVIYESAGEAEKLYQELFTLEIPNDLKFVDQTIREYYRMEGGKE